MALLTTIGNESLSAEASYESRGGGPNANLAKV